MYLELFQRHLKRGRLELVLPSGQSHCFGSGTPTATWIIHQEKTLKRIVRHGDFELGETYMHGGWDVAGRKLNDLISLLCANFNDPHMQRWLVPLKVLWHQWNRIRRSYSNVSLHYDLDETLFRSFLDRELHYSCAYFPNDHCSLEEAQQHKCELIAKKLLLRPGQKVLDIGCGWGSLAMYLAQHYGVEVVGITLSQEQLAVARRRAKARGLDNHICFSLEDYREHQGYYDRIVSVGMFEHVGKPFYPVFFSQVKNLLTPDGIALLHTIGRSGPPGVTNPWIRKYIFPGGYIPALSEIEIAIEHSGLVLTDAEVLRLHYAKTLSAWAERFERHRDEIVDLKGEVFARMWEFYLHASEVSFRLWDNVVFQLQLTRHPTAAPITRDYLYSADDRHELAS